MKRTKEQLKANLTAVNKWQDANKEIYSERQRVRMNSVHWLDKVFPNHPKGYQIHHGFGWNSKYFLLLSKGLHKKLHNEFGRANDNSLYDDDRVRAFLKNSGETYYIINETTIKVIL